MASRTARVLGLGLKNAYWFNDMKLSKPPNLALPAEKIALFLDVDGTLAPITARPELSRVPLQTRRTLMELQRQGVQLAALSGRPLTQVRRLLNPLQIAVGGSHGAQVWFGSDRSISIVRSVPQDMMSVLTNGIADMSGVWIEHKPAGIAIHWRQAPNFRSAIDSIVGDALSVAPGWTLVKGHCVHELRAKGRDKGRALKQFMRRPEFIGRWPLAIGDDRTDEDAFTAALELGGAAIRIGVTETTVAPWQLSDVSSLASWLHRQSTALQSDRWKSARRIWC